MDKLHQFVKNNTLYSDHFSFYMRGIPAICLMDNEYNVNDSSNIPLEEVDITKLKELTQIICEFIVNFNVNEFKDLLNSSHTKQYFEIPKSDSVIGYSVVQIDKILREDGAGSYIRYILENKEGNQVSITAQDTKFFDNTYFKKVNSYENYNEHVKYKVTQKNNMNKVEYQDDWLPTTYNVLEGEISVEDALDLLNNQNTFTNYGTIIHDLN